ncbi:MAG: hydroxymethylbilane synthase [Candidatus Polarisedimenticolia bacterium]
MILGTRGSPLAIAQSRWVRDRLCEASPGLEIDMVVIRTTGDQQASPPDVFFGAPGGASLKGIFVKEIEDALLEGRIDLAVHSLKDLPTDQPEGLVIASLPSREDPRDVLVTREGTGLDDLPRGARLGTGSPRRAAQLRRARPDLVIEPVRGNVDTRVKRMKEGRFDGVVLAAAGLSRLGLLAEGALEGAAAVGIPVEACLPAVGQGALAIETRREDDAARAVSNAIADEVTRREITAERAFLAALGGGCRVPVAALARVQAGGELWLRGMVAAPDGSACLHVDRRGAADRAEEIGRWLAKDAMERGAGRLLSAPAD